MKAAPALLAIAASAAVAAWWVGIIPAEVPVGAAGRKEAPERLLSLTVHSVKTSPTAQAMVTVLNSSDRAFSTIFVECAFLSATGEPLTSAKTMVSNIAAGQSIPVKVEIGSAPGIRTASCRISSAFPPS